MLLNKSLKIGDIKGMIYEFENVGDILPKHIHDENNAHITIVAKGKLKAYSHDWELEVSSGEIIDFVANQPHELVALESNTKIINIVKKYDGVLE